MAIKITDMTTTTTPRAVEISGDGAAEWRITVRCLACGHSETSRGTGSVRVERCPKCGSSDLSTDMTIG
jgi:Zn finger protein HypA/HybF involved in hydrogenase expression